MKLSKFLRLRFLRFNRRKKVAKNGSVKNGNGNVSNGNTNGVIPTVVTSPPEVDITEAIVTESKISNGGLSTTVTTTTTSGNGVDHVSNGYTFTRTQSLRVKSKPEVAEPEPSPKLTRTQSLRRSNPKSRSVLSLKRIGSFGSRLLGGGEKKREKQEKSEEEEEPKPEVPLSTGCIYLELYEKLKEHFRPHPEVHRHPIFVKYSHVKQDTLLVSKRCLHCSNRNRMCVIQAPSNILFRQLVKYYQLHQTDQKLESIEFYLDGSNRCSGIIQSDVFEEFSRHFGETIREFRFLSKYSDLGTVHEFRDDIAVILLQLLYVNSDLYRSLVSFELLLSNPGTQRYFRCFTSAFGSQLRALTIKFCLNIWDLEKTVSQVLDLVAQMTQLTSLHLALLPTGNQREKVDLGYVISKICDLARLLPEITEFGLSIDVSLIETSDLDLIGGCIGRFSKAKSLSLTVVGDVKRLNETKIMLNFESLSLAENLEEFSLNCCYLTPEEVTQMASHCRKVKRLNLGCDSRFDQAALSSICKYQSRLESISIRPAMCSTSEGLYLDNDALSILLDQASTRLPNLRQIHLGHCRVLADDLSLVDNLALWALALPEEQFKLELENNRFALVREEVLREKHGLPDNLHLHWVYKRVRQETQL